jgi:hypothetical protein
MFAADTSLPRVFIACAPQDLKYAEVITARARGDQLPVRFDGFGEGRVDEVGWQLECRRRIRSSRVVVVLVSPHSRESRRALWQVACAREHGIPVVGITVTFDDEAERARGAPVGEESLVGWKWRTIAATLMRFASEPARGTGAVGEAAGGAAGAEAMRSAGLATHGSAA